MLGLDYIYISGRKKNHFQKFILTQEGFSSSLMASKNSLGPEPLQIDLVISETIHMKGGGATSVLYTAHQNRHEMASGFRLMRVHCINIIFRE